VADGWKLSSAFVGAGLDAKELAALAEKIPAAALRRVRLVGSQPLVEFVAERIDGSTTRIAELVKAVKSIPT